MDTTKKAKDVQVSAESALAGILALLIEERERRTAEEKDSVRTEVLLASAGMSLDEISAVTLRSYNDVR